MKNNPFILGFSLFTTVMPLFSECVRDGDNISNPVEILITADSRTTRTEYSGEGDVRWSEGDGIGVFAYSAANDRWEFGNNSRFVLAESDGTRGVFRGNLYLGAYIEPGEEHPITYHAYFPYRKYAGFKGVFTATIPDIQYPSASSFDPQADFLVGSTVEASARLGYMNTEEGFVPLGFSFSRPVALARLGFEGIPTDIYGQKIEKIIFAAGDAPIAGNVKVDLCDGSFLIDEDEFSGTITLVYENGEVLDENFGAWFAMYPAAARSFSLHIETADYYIDTNIDVTAGEEIHFGANTLSLVPVVPAPESVTPKTKPPTIPAFHELKAEPGDFSGKYLIVCDDRAMGASLHSTYNVAGVDISAAKNEAGGFYEFPGGEPGFVYTIARLDGVEPEGGYLFGYTIRNETLGYIRTSSDSYNRITAAPDSSHDWAKWDLRLNPADGAIDITNPKAITTNFSLRWNGAEEFFAAYAGTQDKPRLFKLLEPGETVKLAAPALSASVTTNSFKIAWNTDSRADGYRVSVDGSDWSGTIAAAGYEQSGLPPATSFTVRVKAVGSGIYSDSAHSEITVTTASEIPVETGFPAVWDTGKLETRADGKYHATSGNAGAYITTDKVAGTVGISSNRLNAINWRSGASWLFAIPVEGMAAGRIAVSLTCRSSDMGPKTFRILYSCDGKVFTDSGATLTATSGDSANGFVFTPETEGNPSVFYIKFESAGDALGGGSLSSAGSNRLTAIVIAKE